jgi:hypothetical protein
MKNVLFTLSFLVLASCSSTLKLPVSNETPAAVITVKHKKDKNENHTLTITAENLASAQRLSPPRETYVVWVETAKNGLKNVGQLNPENGKKTTLETVSSFEPVEIIITAEDRGSVSLPTGTEITRKRF